MNTFEDLSKKVIDWANQRNLIHKDNSFKQLLKTVEEIGEISSALLKGDKEGIEDGIGDAFVTLVIFAEQNELCPVKCFEVAYNTIKDRKGKTVLGTFIKNEPGMVREFKDSIIEKESLPEFFSKKVDYNASITTKSIVNYTNTLQNSINQVIESKGEGIDKIINSVKE